MGNKDTFYFSKVDIKHIANPHGLMDFELVKTNILKLFIDGNHALDKSSIALTKKDVEFPDKIEWNIQNNSLHRIALRVEIKNKDDVTLRKFWMTNYGLTNNQVTIYNIPKSTESILITCYHENVINKVATLTITAKN